jgi:hypothetical protein
VVVTARTDWESMTTSVGAMPRPRAWRAYSRNPRHALRRPTPEGSDSADVLTCVAEGAVCLMGAAGQIAMAAGQLRTR